MRSVFELKTLRYFCAKEWKSDDWKKFCMVCPAMVDTNVHWGYNLVSFRSSFCQKFIQMINILNCMNTIKFAICRDLIGKRLKLWISCSQEKIHRSRYSEQSMATILVLFCCCKSPHLNPKASPIASALVISGLFLLVFLSRMKAPGFINQSSNSYLQSAKSDGVLVQSERKLTDPSRAS